MTGARNTPLSFLSAALAVLMLAALGVATLWDMVDGPNSPREEVVAKTPDTSLTLQALKKLPGDARYYLANRYALKDAFIDLDAWVKYHLLGRGWTREVAVGLDGFLFLRNEEMFGQAQGRYRADEETLAAWTAQFGGMKQAFADRGVPFVFIVAPNKPSIYSEVLPPWLSLPGQEDALTNQIIDAARNSGVRAPDLKAYLREVRAKPAGPLLYHRTDTHWTEVGAALAMGRAIGPLGFDLALPDVVWRSVGRGGDLSRLTGWRPDSAKTTPLIARAPGVMCSKDEQPYDLRTFDPLPVKKFSCRNDRARHGEVVVFMDSFGVMAAPTFANAFRTSRFFWRDSVDLGVVDALQHDLVVQIIVERKLPNLPPATLMRSVRK